MNKVILMGRLTKDPEVRYSQGGESPMAIARYTIAVDRQVARNNGADQQSADFIGCVAFGKQGEFAEKYLHKGTKILVEGRIQTGSYEKDGKRVYTTDVVVDRHEFCESKNSQGSDGNGGFSRPVPGGADDGFLNLPGGSSIEDDIPFN